MNVSFGEVEIDFFDRGFFGLRLVFLRGGGGESVK